MILKKVQKKILLITLITIVSLVSLSASAAVRSSSNYALEKDSLNVGGDLSDSASYSLEDTVGEVATGVGTGSSFNIYAGYQQMITDFSLSVTSPDNVSMTPDIDGIAGGTSNGSTTITVITDNPAGYQTTVKASTDPALKSANDEFSDYTPVGADPDFSFSTPLADSVFGFSPEGDDIADSFKDDGSSCNAGFGDVENACWQGFSTADQTILSRSSSNHPAGIESTIKVRAGIGASADIEPGSYSATITITTTAL